MRKVSRTRDIPNFPTQGWADTAFCTRNWSETYFNRKTLTFTEHDQRDAHVKKKKALFL